MSTLPFPPGSIVVAVDGSTHAGHAVAWAARHAHLAKRQLVVVHVTGPENRDAAGIVKSAVGAVHAVAGDVATLAEPTGGDPRVVLVEASRRADLLVMGSHGRGVFLSLLLGSVSAAVAKHAACPVAVVRDPDGDATVHRVIVGADGTPESRLIVEYAYRLASLHRVRVVVVHSYWDVVAAVNGVEETPIHDPETADLGAGLAELVAGLAEDFPDVEAQLVLRHGLVDTVLTAGARPGDIVVVGRHDGDSPAKFLASSIATAVLERARSTVVVVPQPGQSGRL